MSSGAPRLRVVGPPPPARRRPGPAFLAVAAYALLFAAALWTIRSRTNGPQRPGARPASAQDSRAPAASQVRSALLSPEGLSPVARDEYFRRLSAECCTCGCDLNMRDCLVSDQACSRSPEFATRVLEELR